MKRLELEIELGSSLLLFGQLAVQLRVLTSGALLSGPGGIEFGGQSLESALHIVDVNGSLVSLILFELKLRLKFCHFAFKQVSVFGQSCVLVVEVRQGRLGGGLGDRQFGVDLLQLFNVLDFLL